MAYDQRLCVNCLTPFIPRRIDMMFCAKTCTDALYLREEAAYVEFSKALLRQIFCCAFCGKETTEIRLRPLFLKPSDPYSHVVAACLPCKWEYYQAGKHV